jgi:hypothetical protein
MSDWNYLNNLKPGKSGYKRNNFSRPQLMVFVLVFGLVGFLIFKSFAAPNPSLPGDLNNDNTVNVTDLSVLLSNYGTSNSAADINTDGTVNILDMSILLSHYGQSYSPPPVSSSIYWGALMDGDQTYDVYYGPSGFWQDAPWGNSGNTWDRFDSNAGKHTSLVHWGQPQPWSQTAFYGSTADIAYNRGALNVIDYGQDGTDNLSTMVNGGYDAAIRTWAGNVKTWGKPFFMRPWWEMNGQWYSWGKDAASNPALFVNAWRHYHDVVAAAGATNVTWVWCPNLEFGGSTPYSQIYPGDAYVDWTCLDGYNKNSTSTSFTSLYQQSYNDLLALAPTKPIMIGEIGSLEYSGTKAAWITDALGTQIPKNFPKIKAVMWFDWLINEKGPDGVVGPQAFPIESSPSSQAAFKSAISGNSYYAPASNSIVNLPPLTKVPVPN